jgi:hypothetical protein
MRSATQASAGSLHVEIAAAVVTVKARNVAVVDLLEEIARQSGLVVDLEGPLDKCATIEFDRLTLPEALDRILRDQNFALRYYDPIFSADGAREARPSKLWVFRKESREGVVVPEIGKAGLIQQDDLGGQGSPEADDSLDRLRPALADGNAKVRLEAVSELAGIYGVSATVALADAAMFDEDPAVREEAVHGLGESGDPTGMQVLELALMDPDLRVREAAVEAVGDIGGDDSARVLESALNDEVASLREEAVYALGDIGGEIAIGLLRQALTDRQSQVREAAAEVLADMSLEEE